MKNQSPINPDFPVKIQSNEPALQEWVAELASNRDVTAQSITKPKLVLYGNDYLKYFPDHNADSGPRLGALCLTQPFTGSYLEMYGAGIRHLINRSYPLASESLELAMTAAQDSGSNRIVNCSEAHSDLYKRFCTLSDIKDTLTIAEQLVSDIGFEEGRSKAIRLCLKEAVTNAIFHGFRKRGSHDRKYSPESFEKMSEEDSVTLCLRITDKWLVAVIMDNSGILGPLSVMNSLDRHQSNRGLLDERGRGFYLMHQLAQRMIVSIARQQQTYIELHFAINEAVSGPNHFQLLVD